MLLVRAVCHDLLRCVTARSNQGHNDGGQGALFLGRRMTAGCRKVLTMSQQLQCSKFASERPQVRT